jgi:hypothetical protein
MKLGKKLCRFRKQPGFELDQSGRRGNFHFCTRNDKFNKLFVVEFQGVLNVVDIKQ